MPAVHMVCNDAAEDEPLGAQYREAQDAELCFNTIIILDYYFD
jgi:hypothetical protein